MKVDSPEGVLTEVCRLTGTAPDIIKSKSRRLDVVIVRQVYCYTARELTGASMKEIGDVINRGSRYGNLFVQAGQRRH
jgi:chromosomal replication initiation ATPase DnaA